MGETAAPLALPVVSRKANKSYLVFGDHDVRSFENVFSKQNSTFVRLRNRVTEISFSETEMKIEMRGETEMKMEPRNRCHPNKSVSLFVSLFVS